MTKIEYDQEVSGETEDGQTVYILRCPRPLTEEDQQTVVDFVDRLIRGPR